LAKDVLQKVVTVLALTTKPAELNGHLVKSPQLGIPELNLLTESDGIEAARMSKLGREEEVKESLLMLRGQTSSPALTLARALPDHVGIRAESIGSRVPKPRSLACRNCNLRRARRCHDQAVHGRSSPPTAWVVCPISSPLPPARRKGTTSLPATLVVREE
jgi:hypothetical protein